MKGLPLEFGIGVRGPKCLNDGATRWSKKFSDRFSRLDTIPAVTDSQPATHPPSHVALAIRLYASRQAQNLCVLSAIFPGEPGIASFIGAKDNEISGDSSSYKTCTAAVKSSPPAKPSFIIKLVQRNRL